MKNPSVGLADARARRYVVAWIARRCGSEIVLSTNRIEWHHQISTGHSKKYWCDLMVSLLSVSNDLRKIGKLLKRIESWEDSSEFWKLRAIAEWEERGLGDSDVPCEANSRWQKSCSSSVAAGSAVSARCLYSVSFWSSLLEVFLQEVALLELHLVFFFHRQDRSESKH